MFRLITILMTFTLSFGNLTAQVKTTIQVGTSSHYRDIISITPRVQIDDWSIFVNTSYGRKQENSFSYSYLQGSTPSPYTYGYDSIGYQNNRDFTYDYFSIDLGGAYHYSIFERDYYYSGASGGIILEYVERNYLYYTLDLYNGPINQFDATTSYGFLTYNVLDESSSTYNTNNLGWRVNLFSGIDLPISKKLLINVELNAGFVSSHWENDDVLNFAFIPAVRGGIKYLFSKSDK